MAGTEAKGTWARDSSLVSAMRTNYRGQFSPTELRLAYEPPAHRVRYGALFGCPVRFNAAHCELIGDFFALPAPRRAAHALNFRPCERLCEELDQQAGISDQIRTLLQQQDDALTMCEVASRLGMTSRTLVRRLAVDGLVYQDVKDQVRLDKAAHLLRRTRMSVEAVAEATGFRSVRRFRDFFARHPGQSPSLSRRRGWGAP
jgi:methylphosphotriester-DNA--protein-cysteine methyltransferase